LIARGAVSAADRLAAGIAALEAAGIGAARLEAEWLLAGVLGVARFDVYLARDRELGDAAAAAFDAAIARRAAGEPLQYILGWESFRGLHVRVTPDVLVPRPETEALVEWALALLPAGSRVVVDVGTGSGCIAVAVADARRDVRVVAVDVSAPAARLARDNVRALGFASRVTVVIGDVLDAVGGRRADLVIANPPYLPEPLLPTLPREVRDWEPRLALTAGADGLAILRRVMADSRRVLVPDGWLVMETAGEPYVDTVAAELARAGYDNVSSRADLTGTRRLVAARRP
jgi:release factor glutamine methyltransferase